MNSKITKQPAGRLITISTVCLALCIVANILAGLKTYTDKTKHIEPIAQLVAQQLSDASATFVLNGDLVSLQAFTRNATRHEGVQHAAIYNVQNQLLAQSGRASLANQGLQVRSEISLQNRLLGYTRLSLKEANSGLFNTPFFIVCALTLALASLIAMIKLNRVAARTKGEQEESAAAPSMVEKQRKTSSYQHLVEPEGDYAIVAVELLQLPLMRRQLSEETLYEYLATFEHWLYLVANEYAAQIRVGETGFTLILSADNSVNNSTNNNQFAAHSVTLSNPLISLAASAAYCSYTLTRVFEIANKDRLLNSEPMFEARIGTHLSSPLAGEAKLLRQLYAQDAHRQAWQACKGKAAGTVNLTHSVVNHPNGAEIQIEEHDNNGFYQLKSVSPEVSIDIDEKVQRIMARAPEIYDSMVAESTF